MEFVTDHPGFAYTYHTNHGGPSANPRKFLALCGKQLPQLLDLGTSPLPFPASIVLYYQGLPLASGAGFVCGKDNRALAKKKIYDSPQL